ncbi:hypothetical protein RI367_007514 [Sorochytrium milnesiophthora]
MRLLALLACLVATMASVDSTASHRPIRNPMIDVLRHLSPPTSAKFHTEVQQTPPPVFHSKKDYLVTQLPGLALGGHGGQLYAGHLPVDNLNSTEFFVYHTYDNSAAAANKKQPAGGEQFGPEDVVVWLNGGPGASSLLGLFVENGPIHFDASGKPNYNKLGWQQAGNVIFLESPTGVGYSYTKDASQTVRTIDDVANQFWRFTQEFMTRFPETQKYRWWITGESFGGMYVPHIARRVLQNNDKIKARLYTQHNIKVNLQGIAIGNGAYFSPYDIPVNWFDYIGVQGLLRNATLAGEMRTVRDQCSAELAKGKPVMDNMPNCEQLMGALSDPTTVMALTEGANCLPDLYDVRVTKCDAGDPTDGPQISTSKFLNDPKVQQALHAVAPGQTVRWHGVNGQINQALYWNGDQPSVELLPGLIDRIPVLLYNGDKDIICNWIGAQNTLAHVTWKGHTGFVADKFAPYKVNGKQVGEYKRERGLTFLRVYDAGHMVPYYQPEASLGMLKDFMRGAL